MKNNMEMSLKNREWKEFVISDLFLIERGKRIVISKRIKGNIPLITAGYQNEGVADFIQNKEQKAFKNSITIDMFGNTFYREHAFKCDDNIHILSSEKLNKQIGHFISRAINQSTSNVFSYGKQFRLKTVNKQKILLPTTSQGEPDYEFMEAYMRAKEQEKITAYKNYISKRLKELETVKPIVSLKEKDWSEFEIQKLFDTKIGKNVDGNKVNKETGKTAYITRKESFNGLDGFINFNEEYLTEENPVITIGNETAEPFVQNYPFFTGTKVNILLPKNELNRFSLMFVATSLRMHKSKYSYSFTINSTRIKRQKILLPINKEKNPDYEYMEHYIKCLELEKIKKYLNYKALQ